MAEMSLLDRAAEVRQKAKDLDVLVSAVKAAGGEWTGYYMAGIEAAEIAKDGLAHAWRMLDRLMNLARQELSRAEKPKDSQ